MFGAVPRLGMVLVIGITCATPVAAQEIPDDLPEGVTADMIREGAGVFTGQGICMACHGQDGKGMPNLGADLTDDEWVHSDGSYEGILQTILDGVSSEASSTGTTMPPKGGSSISDEQARAVAAYVWSLNRVSN